MGNAWFVSPLSDEWTDSSNALSVSAPPEIRPGIAPSLNQVFRALNSFADFRVDVRRGRWSKGQIVTIESRRPYGTVVIGIRLIGVIADDLPADVIVFDYIASIEEVVAVVTELASECGPLVLWHDSGGEPSRLITARNHVDPDDPSDPDRA